MSKEAGWDPSKGTINLNDVAENAGREPLAPGDYEIQISDATFGSSSKGNPMITLTLEVVENEDDEVNGRKLYYHITLNNALGLGRLKKAAVLLCPDADLSNFNPEEDCEEFVGRRCRAKVVRRTYEGALVNNVKDLLPSSEGGFFG